MATKTKLIKKVKSLYELKQLAAGNEEYQKLCICALSNIGCEHLAEGDGRNPQSTPKWKRHYHGLYAYLGSMVGEYGIPEDLAERDLVAEINNVRDCLGHIKLED